MYNGYMIYASAFTVFICTLNTYLLLSFLLYLNFLNLYSCYLFVIFII
jgi:hypothetical protein